MILKILFMKIKVILILKKQEENSSLQRVVIGSGGTENLIIQGKTLYLTTCLENI